MNIGAAFPSKFLKSSDIAAAGKPVRVTIDRVEMEEVGQGDQQDHKPVLYFRGKEKGMVLNVTNSNSISDVYGTETDDWGGQVIELYVAKVQFQSRMVDAIRVQVPRNKPATRQAPAPARQTQMAASNGDSPIEDEPAFAEDGIPF